jgi:alcohol dehydrogenase
MKAAVVPAVSSSWQIKGVPQPQPGSSQVLVKMRASGICYTDVYQRLGHLPGPFPRILGHEPIGEIVAVAPGVTARKVGDRVGTAWIRSTCGRCEWCQRGRRMFCPDLKGTGIEAQGVRVHADECRRNLSRSRQRYVVGPAGAHTGNSG